MYHRQRLIDTRKGNKGLRSESGYRVATERDRELDKRQFDGEMVRHS